MRKSRFIAIAGYTAMAFLVCSQAIEVNAENLLHIEMYRSKKRMEESIFINLDQEEADSLEYDKVLYDPMNAVLDYGCENVSVAISADPDIVDLSKVGEQKILYTVTATDQYEQEVSVQQIKTYVIEDTQNPEIELKESSIKFQEGEKYDASDNIESVSDPIDGDLKSSEDLEAGTYTVNTDLDCNIPGTYEAAIEAMDMNGNVSKETFQITVTEKPKPVVTQPASESSYSNYPQQSYSQNFASDSSSVSLGDGFYTMGSSGAVMCGGYQAGLYYSDLEDIQGVIDGYGAGYTVTNAGAEYIADHSFQGFDATIYNSILYIKRPNGSVETWQKVSSFNAPNKSFTSYDGVSAWSSYIAPLVTQACTGEDLYFAFWTKIG